MADLIYKLVHGGFQTEVRMDVKGSKPTSTENCSRDIPKNPERPTCDELKVRLVIRTRRSRYGRYRDQNRIRNNRVLLRYGHSVLRSLAQPREDGREVEVELSGAGPENRRERQDRKDQLMSRLHCYRCR